ncbi:hypothetical protein K3495_g15913, partial [Podosphaera aphanis]
IIDELLLALRPLNEAMYHLLHSEMTNKEEADIPADFRSWVEIVKGKLATTHYDVPSQVSRATFATLQGQDMNHVHNKPSKKKGSGKDILKRDHDDSSEGQAKRRKKKQDCPCGRGCTGSWAKCYYLTPSVAPSNFEPIPEIINRIKDLREARPGLDSALRHHEDRMKNLANPTGREFIASTFAINTVSDEELLARSYIADTGANTHLINSSHRYQVLRKAYPSEFIASGKDRYPIDSIGTATFTARGPNGAVDITLEHVLLVPGFFTNIISISQLTTKKIFLSVERQLMYKRIGEQCQIIAYCPLRNGHYILSTRPQSNDTSVFAHAMERIDTVTDSSRRVHECMGHPGQRALSLLTATTTGLSFTGRGPSI